ncbi:MAG: hypothetical protein WA919_17335 [Coleofasciculaceae cyanobacterium]
MAKKIDEVQAKFRLLLALWNLGGKETAVNKGELTKKLVSKGQKASDYQGLFDELEQIGAIESNQRNKYSPSPKGLEMLGEMLKTNQVEFKGTIVGTWVANALVKFYSQMNGSVKTLAVPEEVKPEAIASYDKFEHVALDVYDKLNRDYNLDDLVPIYRMRREIGDRVSRSQFNEWLLEMQANDILQLQGGSVEDSASDKIEDSITTELGGLRCYAKHLKA